MHDFRVAAPFLPRVEAAPPQRRQRSRGLHAALRRGHVRGRSPSPGSPLAAADVAARRRPSPASSGSGPAPPPPRCCAPPPPREHARGGRRPRSLGAGRRSGEGTGEGHRGCATPSPAAREALSPVPLKTRGPPWSFPVFAGRGGGEGCVMELRAGGWSGSVPLSAHARVLFWR
jgi:hypothetical protein